MSNPELTRALAAMGPVLLLDDAADQTRKLARPTRRHPQPVERIDAGCSWLQRRTLLDVEFAPDFAGSDASVREAYQAAWQSLGHPPPGATPQLDAILLALCLTRHKLVERALDVDFIDYLVAHHGLPTVMDILLEAMRFDIDEQYVEDGKNILRIGLWAASVADDRCWAMSEGQWCLRTYLAAAAQDVYEVCAARISAGMATVGATCQVALAQLLPDLPEVTHQVIARLCAEGVETPDAVHYLQLGATDPGALAQARGIKVDHDRNFWSQPDMVSTILLEHGVDAVRWLAPGALFDYPADALTRIGTPEALETLARVASTSKSALARFKLAAGRWPFAAALTLARLPATSKDAALLQPTLVELLREHPDLPTQLRPWLEAAANALVDSFCARLAGPRDIAAPEELPAVLVPAPPLPAKKKPALGLQLPVLPLAPLEYWGGGEKEAHLALNPHAKSRYEEALRSPERMVEVAVFLEKTQMPEYQLARSAIVQGDAAALLAAWRSGVAALKKKGISYQYWFDSIGVAHLPPALGIPFWNAAASEASCRDLEFVAAAFGLPALPGILARIIDAPKENLGAGLRFGAVELGPVAARAYARLKSQRAFGEQWLARFPEHAACALMGPALGKPGEARDCAAVSLRYLAAIGHTALLEQVAARHGKPEVLPALHAMLADCPAPPVARQAASLPDFWMPSGWRHPLLHNGRALPAAALDTLGTIMASPTIGEVYVRLDGIKAACTVDSLTDFAWDCFSAWLNASAPPTEAWVMSALGVFGTDDTARKLTALIRAWPGEGAHARAVAGLDVLAAIGSDVALMLLNGIAQKVKFKGLQDKAREKIEAIARTRGLSAEELEDRLAPDLGLDQHGSMILDFGPRAFRVGFDEALVPYVREWQDDDGTNGKAGARLPDLPKPKKTDDSELARLANERFKLLKKDVRTIASQQVLRLELAMCMQRRWSPAVFAQFMATHPLVRHLVRRLVWGVYVVPFETTGAGEDQESHVANYGGTLQACFRVADDGEYTTADDDRFTVPEGGQYRVGLPHALELPAEEAAGFSQLLADYELLQPFAQLGRDTYALSDAERSSDALQRWNGVTVATGKVRGLAHVGWRRGPAQDGGAIWTYDKPAGAAGMLELGFEPGLIVHLPDEDPEQTLGEITLGSGVRGGSSRGMTSFATLDPILASELIRDMQRLCS